MAAGRLPRLLAGRQVDVAPRARLDLPPIAGSPRPVPRRAPLQDDALKIEILTAGQQVVDVGGRERRHDAQRGVAELMQPLQQPAPVSVRVVDEPGAVEPEHIERQEIQRGRFRRRADTAPMTS